jgi:hypothetical protein
MAARKRQAKKSTSRTKPAEIVQAIVDEMTSLRWRRGRTDKEFAARYGLSVSRIQNLSAEASRIVKGAIEDPEEIRAQLFDTFLQIATEARGADRPDYNAAARSLSEAADMVGLKKQRLEIELEADLDKKLEALADKLPAEVFRDVAAILAGKGGRKVADGDAGE